MKNKKLLCDENCLYIYFSDQIKHSLIEDDLSDVPLNSHVVVALLSDNEMDSVKSNGCYTVLSATSIGKLIELVVQEVKITAFDTWQPLLIDENNGISNKLTLDFYRGVSENFNNTVISRNTSAFKSRVFLENAFTNLHLVQKSIGFESLFDADDCRPVLIIGGGPSLDKQLHLLKVFRNKFRIIVPGSVYPALQNTGIVPDIILITDANNVCLWDENIDSIIAADIGCNSEVLDKKYKNLFLSTHTPQQRDLFSYLGIDIKAIPSGGSVSNSAYSLARMLKAEIIIFIGMDMALTDGKDHSKFHGHQYDKTTLDKKLSSALKVKGYFGDEVLSERNLVTYKKWFEKYIVSDKKTLVFNCTEGGANIDGCFNVPFKEVCDTLPQLQYIESNPCNHNTSHTEVVDESLIKALKLLRVSITKMQKLLSELITYLNDQQDINRKFKRIDKFNLKLKKLDASAKMLIEAFSDGQVNTALARIEKFKYTSQDQGLLGLYVLLYKAMLHGAKSSSFLLKGVIGDLSNDMNLRSHGKVKNKMSDRASIA